MEVTFKNENLGTYRDHGYQWDTRIISHWDDERKGEVIEFRTNPEGEGLWLNGQQVLGTTQFSLAGIKDVQGKIRRAVAARLNA